MTGVVKNQHVEDLCSFPEIHLYRIKPDEKQICYENQKSMNVDNDRSQFSRTLQP